MIAIIYSTRHGSTAKIAKVINAYIGDCRLMNLKDIDYMALAECDTIVLGMPVYNGKLDEDMVNYINEHQAMLIEKNYSIYVTALFFSEFMHYVTEQFPYKILKDVKVIAGLGGAIYYPDLSIPEKVQLSLLNTVTRVVPKEHNETIFENFNDEEIHIFANKIKRIDDESTQAN